MFTLCSIHGAGIGMNWNLAVEKNREALKRILVTLLAMMGAASRPTMLPRNIHRLILRLLRPAEAATRRLIIIAARALVVESRPAAMPTPTSGSSRGLQRGAPGHTRTPARIARGAYFFSLLDPLIRAKNDCRDAKPKSAASVNIFGLRIPLLQRAPAPASPRLPDDPLDAGNLARRLEAIGQALDDLPYQARRLARWQARRDAAWGVDTPPPNVTQRKAVQAKLACRSRQLSPMRTRRRGDGNLTLRHMINRPAALPHVRLDTS
jgi:hypothetical protein